jgi:predicted lysophospholipase L1 biosynthesis ABC-type transport system permease subunit
MNQDKKEKEISKKINQSLWITTITAGVSVVVFVFAYFQVKNIWLLVLAGATVLAILVFHRVARNIKYQLLQSLAVKKNTEEIEE